MNTIQDTVSQSLLTPFRIPGNKSAFVSELKTDVQPTIDSWPFFALDGALNSYTLTGNFAQGVFNSIFPAVTPSGNDKPIRIYGVSLYTGVALGAGVTISGQLLLARTGGNNVATYQPLSPLLTFTTGDMVVFGATFLQNEVVLLRPSDLDFVGYFGKSLVGAAPSVAFSVLYQQY